MAMPSAASLPAEARAALTGGSGLMASTSLPNHGVPALNMADGPMGVASMRVDERDVSQLTPCGTALAASWDLELVRRIGALVGEEARRRNVQVVLAPNVNMPRSPLAGRAFETFSEDPWLSGVLGAAWITGLQGRGVASCVKHLAGNDSETDRDTLNALIDMDALHEVYLRPFAMAAEAGAWAMLAAYNRLNGFYCAEHPELLGAIVKRLWGYDGALISDWFAVKDGLRSLAAGLDLEMPGPPRFMGARLGEGADPERVTEAASAVLRLAERTTAFEPDPYAADDRALLTEAAAAGLTLLRNEGELLPLAPARIRRLAVLGPNAAAPCYQGGTFAKIAVRPDAETPLAAIARRFDACEIVAVGGVGHNPRLPPMRVVPITDLGDGMAGMTVSYFRGHDLDATPVFRETRDTNSLTWFAMPGGVSPLHEGGVRAEGVFTPRVSGPHRLHAGATGPVRLLLDGAEVYRSDHQPPKSDLMGVLKAGDSGYATVELVAGVPVTVAVELRWAPFRAQGLWYGIGEPLDPAAEMEQAVAAARDADAVVLIVGEHSDNSVESRDRADTFLDRSQIRLIERVCEANPDTVVVVNAGHAVDLSWAALARAVMVVWYPGEMFGAALADVLAGDREPGGRLPVTFARSDADYPAYALAPAANGDLPYDEGWWIGYRSFQRLRTMPRYFLGEGLGYTRFAIEDVVATGTGLGVAVRNIGTREGKVVVQAYADRVRQGVAVMTLAGIAVAVVPPGNTDVLTIALDPHAFDRWDEGSARWVADNETATRRIGVGFSLRDLTHTIVLGNGEAE